MYNDYKVNAIVTARMTSSRLPGKVLFDLAGKPSLQHIIERLRRSKYIDEVVIATTTNETDNPIIELCEKLECKYYRGSEHDVLSRVLEASREFDTDIIVDITGDCCVCDWNIVDELIENLKDNSYCSNVIQRTFPRGLDAQVFWHKTLEIVALEVDNEVDIQHVTSWIYKNPKNHEKYKKNNLILNEDHSNFRLTLDTEEDYQLLKFLFEAFGDNLFSLNDIVNFFKFYPELATYNAHIPQKNYYNELVKAYEK